MFALLLLAAAARLPDDGLIQRFEEGRRFEETLDVTTVTRPPDSPDADPVRGRYTLTLTTETADADASGAGLRSRLDSIRTSITSPGGTVDAAYDSDNRRVEDDGLGRGEAEEAADAALKSVWEPLRGLTLRRQASAAGGLSLGEWVGRVAGGDDDAVAEAAAASLTTAVAVPLPEGPLDSWTGEADWPLGGQAVPVLRLMTYDGKTADGQDRIKLSLASKAGGPQLAGKGEALFDRSLGRVVSVDLVIKAETRRDGEPLAVTSTNIAWRLRPLPAGA